MSYARVIHKKREEKVLIKLSSVRDIKNNGYSDARLKKEKRKMNKIAHVFLQKCFKFETRETCFKDHSRIRIATIYSTHMHNLI
jgi:hypothetical protein